MYPNHHQEQQWNAPKPSFNPTSSLNSIIHSTHSPIQSQSYCNTTDSDVSSFMNGSNQYNWDAMQIPMQLPVARNCVACNYECCSTNDWRPSNSSVNNTNHHINNNINKTTEKLLKSVQLQLCENNETKQKYVRMCIDNFDNEKLPNRIRHLNGCGVTQVNNNDYSTYICFEEHIPRTTNMLSQYFESIIRQNCRSHHMNINMTMPKIGRIATNNGNAIPMQVMPLPLPLPLPLTVVNSFKLPSLDTLSSSTETNPISEILIKPKNQLIVAKFECLQCHKAFSTKSGLSNHRIIHMPKGHKCNYANCSKTFARSCDLTRHIRLHTGHKPFVCFYDKCTKKFTRSVQLRLHVMDHTGERPFKCDICHKGFKTLQNAKIHKRIHTGEKPFECQICRKKFTQSSSLKTHCNNIHR